MQKNRNKVEMRAGYDFSKAKGVRGKYYRAMRQGYSITIHHTDGTKEVRKFGPEKDAMAPESNIREYFHDPDIRPDTSRTHGT